MGLGMSINCQYCTLLPDQLQGVVLPLSELYENIVPNMFSIYVAVNVPQVSCTTGITALGSHPNYNYTTPYMYLCS